MAYCRQTDGMVLVKVVVGALAVVASVPVGPADNGGTTLGASTAPREHARVSLGQSSLGALFANALKATQGQPTTVTSTAKDELLEAEQPVRPTDPAETGHDAPSASATLADTILNAVQSEDLSSLSGEGGRS